MKINQVKQPKLGTEAHIIPMQFYIPLTCTDSQCVQLVLVSTSSQPLGNHDMATAGILEMRRKLPGPWSATGEISKFQGIKHKMFPRTVVWRHGCTIENRSEAVSQDSYLNLEPKDRRAPQWGLFSSYYWNCKSDRFGMNQSKFVSCVLNHLYNIMFFWSNNLHIDDPTA